METSHPQPGTSRRLTSSLVAWLPLVAALLFTFGFFGAVATPLPQLLWYLVVAALTLTVPGTLLYRALLKSSGDLLADAAAGTSIGLLLQLLFWFVFVSLGIGDWLILGPLLVLTLFAIVPRLRRHWKTDQNQALPKRRWLAHWGVAALYCITLVAKSPALSLDLPPGATDWYQDQYWHLGNSAGFLTNVVSLDMRVAGQPLVYHWFANAHIAAQTLSSGLDLNLVFARLWLIPIFAGVIALTWSIVWRLTNSWWPGLIAAAMVALGANLDTIGLGLPSGTVLVPHSPSQNYSVLAVLLVVLLLLTLWQDNRLPPGGWVLLALALLAAPGAKSSTLPILICALALATLSSIFFRRNWKPFAIALALAVGALAATLPFLGGGGAGTRLQLFSTVRRNSVFSDAVGLTSDQIAFPDSVIPPGLLSGAGLLALGALLVAFITRALWLAPGRSAFRSLNPDIAWALLGLGIAGFSAMMLIDHDGLSQIYFFSTGVLGWYLLSAWGFHRLVADAPKPARWGVLSGSLIGVIGMVLWLSFVPRPVVEDPVLAIMLSSAVVLVPSGISYLLTRHSARPKLRVSLAAALIAASLTPGALSLRLPDTEPSQSPAVSAAEYQAAAWIRRHAAPADVVATNLHCRGTKGYEQPCDNRSFWLSAFSQRPVLIEGWAYTDDAHLRHGENGLPYSQQPFHDQELFEANEQVFLAPNYAAISKLREHDVRWLFAATERRSVSPNLANYAREVFSNSAVTIYELK